MLTVEVFPGARAPAPGAEILPGFDLLVRAVVLDVQDGPRSVPR